MRTLVALTLAGCLSDADLSDEAGKTGLDVDSAMQGAGGPAETRVVVLVLDGLRIEESFGDGYSDVSELPTASLLPRVRSELFDKGTLIPSALATGITSTSPGHCDLLTGQRQAFGNLPLVDDPGAYLPEFPTLTESLPEGQSAIITGSPLLIPFERSVSSQGGIETPISQVLKDVKVLDVTRDWMRRSDLRLVVANLHQADALAHYGDEGAYPETVQDLDDLIVDFWLWIEEQPGWQGRTVMALVADHGRHRQSDLDEDWRDHGDDCAGCRQIPMFLVGPGIEAGKTLDSSHNLEDLGQTLAHLLGQTLPYGSGLVIEEALTSPVEETLEGQIHPSAAGEHRVAEELTGDPTQRSVVTLNDQVVSDHDALMAEAPRVAARDELALACWRELHIDPDEERWPWEPRCQRLDESGEWREVEGPVNSVWPLWRPSLAIDEAGVPWMAWVDNPSGKANWKADVLLSSLDEDDQWTSFALRGSYFPTHPALAMDDDQTLVAFSGSQRSSQARFFRQIYLVESLPGGELRTRLAVAPETAEVQADLTVPDERLERPAVWIDGTRIAMAWIGYSASEEVSSAVWRVMSDDGGHSWSQPEELARGRVEGHITPLFTDHGTLVWAQLGGSIEICLQTLDSDTAHCEPTRADQIMGLAWTENGLVASLGTQRSWTLTSP